MKQLFLFISLLIMTLGHSQVDFQLHNKLLLNAHRSYSENEFKKALDYYENAFSLDEANSAIEYVNAAICAAEINDKKKCLHWISESVIQKKASLKTLKNASDNTLYKACISEIASKYGSLLNQHFKNQEHPYVSYQIQELLNRDQFSRQLGKYHLGISDEQEQEAFDKYIIAQEQKDTLALKKYKAILFPKVSKTQKAYELNVMRYTDSLNIRVLMDITREYGWQKEAHLLLWHQRGTYGKDNWVWNYFKPLINKEIKSGKIAPSFWAIFEDFKSINKTGKSIYGYHPGKVNPQTVNINRRKIGLPELTTKEIQHRNQNPFGGRVF